MFYLQVLHIKSLRLLFHIFLENELSFCRLNTFCPILFTRLVIWSKKFVFFMLQKQYFVVELLMWFYLPKRKLLTITSNDSYGWHGHKATELNDIWRINWDSSKHYPNNTWDSDKYRSFHRLMPNTMEFAMRKLFAEMQPTRKHRRYEWWNQNEKTKWMKHLFIIYLIISHHFDFKLQLTKFLYYNGILKFI